MEDDIGARADELFGRAGRCEIRGHDLDRAGEYRLSRREHVGEREPLDRLSVERAGDEPLRQLAADHSGRPGDEDVHVGAEARALSGRSSTIRRRG